MYVYTYMCIYMCALYVYVYTQYALFCIYKDMQCTLYQDYVQRMGCAVVGLEHHSGVALAIAQLTRHFQISDKFKDTPVGLYVCCTYSMSVLELTWVLSYIHACTTCVYVISIIYVFLNPIIL